MNQTLRTASLGLLSAGTLALAGCGNTSTTETAAAGANSSAATVDSAAMMTDSARMGKAAGVLVDGVPMTPNKTIVQNAVQAPSVATLVKAVRAAGIDGTLGGPGPYTVFAPTNAAFDKLPKGALDGLLKPESKDKLKGVLTYHVLAGRLLAQDLQDGQALTTVQGQKIKVSVKNGQVMINNATIQTPDIVSSNGVTHLIDNVLLPSAE